MSIKQAVNAIKGCTYVQELGGNKFQLIIDGVTRVITLAGPCPESSVEHAIKALRHIFKVPEQTYTKADMQAMFGKGYAYGCREGGDVATAFEKALASIAQ